MILELLILLLGIPTGYLIAWLTKDELASGKNYFRILIIASILAGVWFYLSGEFYISWTSTFIFIFSLISFVKSNKSKI